MKAAGKKLVVVDFYATWCDPCRRVAPKVEKLAREYKGEVVFLKVDVDKLSDLRVEYNIHAMPTFVFIKNKKELERSAGAKTKIKEIIERLKNASPQEARDYEVLQDAADDVLRSFAEGLDEITPFSGSQDNADTVSFVSEVIIANNTKIIRRPNPN